MRVLIEQSAFMDVEFIKHARNCCNNSDRFTFKLRAESQPIQVDGKDVSELSFDVTGVFELDEMINAMVEIKKLI